MLASSLRRIAPALCQVPIRNLPLSCTDFEALKIEKVDADDNKGLLKVKWEDGVEGRYPYVWLQDCAPPSGDWGQNYLGTDSRPLPVLAELNVTTKPEHVEILPIGQGILVQWPVYNQVNYPSSWLRQHFRNSMDAWNNNESIWDRQKVEKLGGVPTFKAGVNISNYFGEIKQAVKEFGVVRIQYGMAMEKEILDGIGLTEEKRVPMNATCYAQHSNDLHTGVPFLNPIPNITTMGFHGKPKYGQVQLADGFMVAKILRKKHPFTFQYLCSTKITYSNLDRRCEFEQKSMHSLVSEKHEEPVFVLKDNGFVDRVIFSNPCRASQQHIPPGTIQELYAALKLFNSFCYDAANMVNLEPGGQDLLVIDNNRILHGTTAFHGDPRASQITENFYHWDG